MAWRKSSKIKFPYNESVKGKTFTIPVLTDHKKWSDTKYNSLKKHIKYHLSVVQDNICAYCREPIHFNGYGDPIEHIVAKSLKPKWMFHPKNLCLACYGCNTKKSSKETMVGNAASYGSEYADFRTNSSDYSILHPYFDKFSDLIIEEGFIFKQNPADHTGKGDETIRICELNRLDLLYTRARKKAKNNSSMHSLAVKIINDPNSSKEDIKLAKNMVAEIVKRFKYWKELHKK